MPDTPPALAQMPQFSEKYWAKAPRETMVAHIQRVTTLEEGWVEIVMKEGMVLRRKREDIKQLLAPNAEVHIETFNKELVTGLFVPPIGWAFRMTAADLAQYAKDLSVEVHRQQQATEQAMVSHVALALDQLMEIIAVYPDTNERAEVALTIAKAAITALRTGPQQ